MSNTAILSRTFETDFLMKTDVKSPCLANLLQEGIRVGHIIQENIREKMNFVAIHALCSRQTFCARYKGF